MHIFRSEGPISYGEYQFGYCQWLERAPEDALPPIYAAGYLPFSAGPEGPLNRFYMARSLRIRLCDLHIRKDRRYDHRQWAAFLLERHCASREAFMESSGREARALARKWMEARFGEAYLDAQRLERILNGPPLSDVLYWKKHDRLVAFALLVRENGLVHYWYVFYENGDSKPTAPGHGYLVDFLLWARENGLEHAYLGTAYGIKSRYKTRGLSGIEFWDGNQWDSDRARLRLLQEQDALRAGT
ncbi:MAG: hypothetical protein R6V45_08145 [Oceanipulchritudo sp.]